ncbi:hypothetical protein HMPREF3038_03259 [Akkermansia sp. KLE1797]|nr:hypothetical protein HMPREF3038_03259 [Akkermansia sp. KLE1797]KXU55127.1 hypothetical protein HMPREF3039_00680 [Akkermansia sp. KLE1798]KZA06129.1 hypothetical protein HMPREF1326_00168 [Akkermansia sp. KLE1605]
MHVKNRSRRRVASGGEFLLPYPPSLSITNYVSTEKVPLYVRIKGISAISHPVQPRCSLASRAAACYETG